MSNRYQIYQYVFINKKGKCSEFIKNFGKTILNELNLLGYISIYPTDKNCLWELTEKGKKFIFLYLKSFQNKKHRYYSIADIMRKVIF